MNSKRLNRIARGRERTPQGAGHVAGADGAHPDVGIHRVATLQPLPGLHDVRNAGSLVEIASFRAWA